MADLLGVKRTTYANWEQNTEPEIGIIRKISKILGVELSQLISSDSNVNVPFMEQRDLQEQIIAINAQLRVLFLKLVEMESQDPKTHVKRSSATVTLELEDLIRQETKRLLNELKLS